MGWEPAWCFILRPRSYNVSEMLRIIILSCLLHAGYAWLTETTHTKVILDVTQNVTINCRYDSNTSMSQKRMAEVTRIMLRKQKENSTSFTYARVTDNNPVFVQGGNPEVSVAGSTHGARHSFLSVTWAVASRETLGEYTCIIDGFGADESLLHADTNPVTIVEAAKNCQLSMRRLEVKHQQDIDSLKTSLDSLKSDVQAENKNILSKIEENRCGKCEGGLKKDEVVSIVKSVVKQILGAQWPGGRYALPKTDKGCPSHSASASWLAGYIKLHSESDDSYKSQNVSNPNHMAKPIFEREDATQSNFAYMRTCMAESNSVVPSWPKGSYCIHRVSGECPQGFQGGSIGLDTEDAHPKEVEFFNAPDNLFFNKTYVYVHFCCRHDGSSDDPITLPVTEPFFLYRYKGRCQKVENANVSEEWYTIRTEVSQNQDRYSNGTYPDSSLDPVTLRLCYYQ